MKKGIIKKIKTGQDKYKVYVSSLWDKLDLNEKGEFLNNLSKARTITGHSPFLSIIDENSNKIVAYVSKEGIKILVNGEFVDLHPSITVPSSSQSTEDILKQR